MFSRHLSRGQILPLVAFALTVLVGMAAFAVDIGYWRYQQRLQQSAADSAALAGGIERNYSTALSDVTIAARKDATSNGFTDDGGTTTTVTVNDPPASGAYAGNAAAVEVIVTKKQPAFFAGIFGSGTNSVSTRAVAAENNQGAGCIYTLTGSITVNGGAGGVSAPNCGIIANGGLSVNGNGTIDASSIGYASGSAPKGGTYTEATPAPAIPAADPCPTIPGCAYLNANPPSVAIAPAPTVKNGVTTYSPGEYTSELDPAKSSVFLPGLYVLDNGFNAKGNDTITGSGVTLYNKGGAITIGGNTSIDFTAPSSGNYSGVVLYQPASNTNGLSFGGKSGANGFEGAMYFPTASLSLNGSLPDVTMIIAASITINGQGITVSNAGVTGGFGHYVLAE